MGRKGNCNIGDIQSRTWWVFYSSSCHSILLLRKKLRGLLKDTFRHIFLRLTFENDNYSLIWATLVVKLLFTSSYSFPSPILFDLRTPSGCLLLLYRWRIVLISKWPISWFTGSCHHKKSSGTGKITSCLMPCCTLTQLVSCKHFDMMHIRWGCLSAECLLYLLTILRYLRVFFFFK